MKALAHPKRAFLGLVLAGVVCVFLAIGSASALAWRGVRVDVRNETGRDVLVVYGDATLIKVTYEYRNASSRTLASKTGAVFETTGNAHEFFVRRAACVPHRFPEGDALVFSNPQVGFPGITEAVGSHVWGFTTGFKVGDDRLFWFGRVRVTRRKDSAGFKEFTETILSAPGCGR